MAGALQMAPCPIPTSARIALISTGGTIEKTYDELHGVLTNRVSVLDVMLSSLELGGIELERVTLMNKDSLEMNDEDHRLIAERRSTRRASATASSSSTARTPWR